MPRIAPEQLIKCLAILLTPGGGIKSTDEVARLVLLMQRFSKKLVSKCVYVSILKNTELGLLSDFMQHGGWALVFIWLEKAIDAHNQFFIREILDLLMICPVDVNRLKSNDIPKLVKSLSKNNDLGGGVQELAAKIVSKWLAIVKNVAPTVDPCAKVETSSTKKVDPPPSSPPVVAKSEEEPVPVLKITLKKDGKKLVPSSSSLDDESEGGSSDHSDDSTHKTKITRSKKSSDLHEKSKSSSSHKDTSSRDSERRHRSDSKHKSSSSSSSSDKDRHKSSEHKSSRDKSKLSRGEKERDKSSKSSSSSSSASSKNYLKDKERERERERTKKKEKEKEEKDAKLTKIEKDRQIETDQATLARLMVPSINKLGKIPKKTDKAKINELKENIGKSESSVSSSSGEKKEKPVVAPPAPAPDIPKKNISFSIEKRLPSDQKPKTVKTFNAKFRSTGLEEESAKPPPRAKSSSSSSSASSSSIKSSSTSSSTSGEKKAVKRPSPSKELPPEKKHKPSEHSSSEKSADTLSPTEKAKTSSAPKPKVKVFLQESDVFSSALNDAILLKETKKKKRKLSKDEPKEAKVTSPTSQKPEENKPSFKFYRDTLDSTLEESKKKAAETEGPSDTEHEEGPQNETPPTSPTGVNSSPSGIRSPPSGGRSSEKSSKAGASSKRPKRSVRFRSAEDGLEEVFYFELDETERCNVSRPNSNSFTDMRSMERELERENFHMARKLTQEDVQAERTVWTGLIPMDVEKAASVVPGKNSREKEIQKARQMTVKPTIYGGYNVIPPSPAEPDFEIHATTDPALMPAEDSSAEPSTFDYSNLPWPEPLPGEAPFFPPGPGAPPAAMMPPGPPAMMGGPPIGMIPPGMFPPGGPPPFGAPNGNNWMGGPVDMPQAGGMPPMGGPMPPNMFPPGMGPPGMGPPMGMNMGMMGGPPMPPEMMMGGPDMMMGGPPFPPMGPPGMFGPGGPPGFNGPPGPWFGPGGPPNQGPGAPPNMDMNDNSSNSGSNQASSRSKSSGGSWHRGGGEPSKPRDRDRERERDKRGGRPRSTIPCRHKKFCKSRDCPYMHPSSR